MTGNRHIKNYTLPGSTLAEVLVFMIVAGIVFLIIFEGFTLFSKYSSSKYDNIYQRSSFYNAYDNLRTLTSNADSIRLNQDGEIILYSRNDIPIVLQHKDSLLIINHAGTTDTLIRNVGYIELTGTRRALGNCDSLMVYVNTYANPPVILKFPVRKNINEILIESFEKKESAYEYK